MLAEGALCGVVPACSLSGSRWFATRRLAVVVVTTIAAVSATPAAPSSAQAIGDPSPPQCFVTATPNPSPLGSPVSFRFFVSTGTDTPPGPFGVVAFFDGASFLEVDALFPDGVTDHSSVTATRSDLSQGTHTIRAVLDPPLPQCGAGVTVTQTVTAPASSTSLTSSVNPSVYGQATTFTASVTRSNGGTPDGSVQFQADGTDLGAPQTLDGSGHAAMPTAALPAGLHNITAHFTSSGGESDSDGTLFSALLPGQLVEPAASRPRPSRASPNCPSVAGRSRALAASVGVASPGGGTPSGSVQFELRRGGPRRFAADGRRRRPREAPRPARSVPARTRSRPPTCRATAISPAARGRPASSSRLRPSSPTPMPRRRTTTTPRPSRHG